MHAAHVIRDLDLASGGPSRSLPALARGLAGIDPDSTVTVLFQDRGQPLSIDPATESVEFLAIRGNTCARPIRFCNRLKELHRRQPIDVLHAHGMWSPSCHLAIRFAQRHRIPYLVSPRGMLSSWCLKHKSFRKQVAWRVYQREDLQRAGCLHATSQSEESDIRRSDIRCPVTLIPHGCDLPPQGLCRSLWQPVEASDAKIAICIARLHPVKGLDDVIEAWSRVRPAGWKLLIAGPDEGGYRVRLQDQIDRHQLNSVIEIIDAVEGAEKWQLISLASLSISGSHSENFGMSIAESLAAGVPVIATQGTPWQSICEQRCGWWVPNGSAGLATAISEATLTDSRQLSEMGRRGAALIQSQYSWDAIAEHFALVYRWLTDTSTVRPPSVRFS